MGKACEKQNLLKVEAYVMISNQNNQFRVSGMPEHSVESTYIILPVLWGEKHSNIVAYVSLFICFINTIMWLG